MFTEEDWHQDYWKAPVTGSNFSRPPQDSYSKWPHQEKKKKCKNSQVSKDKPHPSFLNKENKLICSKKEGGLKKAYLLIVVENTRLKNASRDLKTSLDHQEDSLASRQKPECE
ncbi:hypothetical protein O181_087387 [Austropuccinia psidii MF-1]|uniref:Uncharacterized protein n=1 Tax=Austropuccinia psidii MF-1 TaxID=1389203 RepID=A0A9Q3P324_9BASI|nr:hypothetical protein [Austropuccinia psidii MF-1]